MGRGVIGVAADDLVLQEAVVPTVLELPVFEEVLSA